MYTSTPTHSHQRKIRYSFLLFLFFLLFDSHIKWTKLYIHFLHISLRSGFLLLCDELIRFAVISLLSFSLSLFFILHSFIYQHVLCCSMWLRCSVFVPIFRWYAKSTSICISNYNYIKLNTEMNNCALKIKWIAKLCSVYTKHMVIQTNHNILSARLSSQFRVETLSKPVSFDLLENRFYFH